MTAARLITPTELQAFNRRQAFRASIANKAAELKASKLHAAPPADKPARPVAAVDAVRAEGAVAPLDRPREKYWFCILGLVENSISIRQVKEAVAGEFAVDVEELIGARRHLRIVIPRQVAMWLCKEL